MGDLVLVRLQSRRGCSVRGGGGMLTVRIILAMMAHDWVVMLHKLNFVMDWSWLGRLHDIDDLFVVIIAIRVRVLTMMLVMGMIIIVIVIVHVEMLVQGYVLHGMLILLRVSVAFSVVDGDIRLLGCHRGLSGSC